MNYIAIIGLVWILCESKLFKPLREAISKKYKVANGVGKWYKPIFWFLDSIFNCHGCMGLWAALIVYLAKDYEIVVFALCGPILSVFVICILKLITWII